MQVGNEIITWDNFHWIGLFMWTFALVSLVCLVVGIYKKSGWLLLFSALTAFPMAYYLLGAENGMKFAISIPIVEGILAFVFWGMNCH